MIKIHCVGNENRILLALERAGETVEYYDIGKNDISGLADGIVGLISDKKRKEDMINIAFDVCKSNFSVDAVIPKMINAYNKICQ